MPYQSVGSPRFFINISEWMEFIGAYGLTELIDIAGPHNQREHYRTLPVIPQHHTGDTINLNFPSIIEFKNPFIAILGHNLQGTPTDVNIVDDFINADPGGSGYWGYSIFSLDETPGQFGLGADADVGSIIYGSFYTMPQADLKITMNRLMDGVKRYRTRGGTDLVNHKFTRSPKWGSLSAWELGFSSLEGTDWETNFKGIGQNLSRYGRRVWDMSFTMTANDLFGSNQSLATEPWGENFDALVTSGGMDSGDVNDDGTLKYDLITDENFYSLIHMTGGGRLPFIFQPDINDNLNWAICKFDMKNNFSFQQKSLGLYTVRLKVREVW